jgi:hypothetical protein
VTALLQAVNGTPVLSTVGTVDRYIRQRRSFIQTTKGLSSIHLNLDMFEAVQVSMLYVLRVRLGQHTTMVDYIMESMDPRSQMANCITTVRGDFGPWPSPDHQ